MCMAKRQSFNVFIAFMFIFKNGRHGNQRIHFRHSNKHDKYWTELLSNPQFTNVEISISIVGL